MNMDSQRSPLLGVSLSYFCQGKSVEDELRSSLWYTKLELEKTKVTVQDELRRKEDQLIQLKELLNKAMRERDEANDKCQTLLLEKLFLQQQQQQSNNNNQSGISSVEFEEEPRRDNTTTNNNNNNGFSSSDCEESIVSSPIQSQPIEGSIELVCDKPLPEKGKLLQAVMRAGPLLQTLLLAGPLPQWRHPPPPLESFEIPPVTIPSPPPQPQALLHQEASVVNGCGRVNRKRVLCEEGFEFESHSPTEAKYQRVVLQ